MSESRRDTALAAAQMVLAGISATLGAAIAKTIFDEVAPMSVAALRSIITALILLPAIRPWRGPLAGKDLRWVLVYGASLGAMNLLFYAAVARVPLGLALGIEICGPLAVALLGSRKPADFMWALLAIGGIALLIPWPGNSGALDPIGIAFALAAGAFWAAYILCGKRASRIGSLRAVALGMTVSALVGLPVGAIAGGKQMIAPHVLAVGLGVALMSSTVPYLLEMRALRVLPSRIYGLITASAPAIAALVGFVVLGETINAIQGLAIALLVGAGAGTVLTSARGARVAVEATASEPPLA